MQLRTIGQSGLKVPQLCFGGNVLGWTVKADQAGALLDTLLDAGLKMIFPDGEGASKAGLRGQILGGLDAIPRVLGQGVVQDALHILADSVEGGRGQGRGQLVEEAVDDRTRTGAIEGRGPDQGLVEDHPDGEEVAAGIRATAL